jgi:hypothetical protein
MRREQRGGDAGQQPVDDVGRIVIPRQREPVDENLLMLQLLPISGQLEPPAQDALPTLAGEWQVDGATVLLTTSGVVRVLIGMPAQCWALHRQGLPPAAVVTRISADRGLDPDVVAERVLPLLEVLPRLADAASSPPT